jgi:hypothetical protein
LDRPQGRTLDRLPRTAAPPLLTLPAAIQPAVARHRPRTEQAVKREIAPWVRPDRLTAVFAFPLRLDHQKVPAWRWQWDQRQQRALQPHAVGKTVRWTDRRELAPQRLVMAYRSPAQVELRCRSSQSRRPGWWWPASHGTASTLAGHALYCLVARLLIRLVLLRLQERHLSMGVDLLTARLRGMQEALVVYANGTAPRVLTERSPEPETLCIALD